MSLAIDAVILLIIILIIVAGAKKGLIRAVMGVFTSVASLIAAYAYTPILADYIQEHYLLDRITANINETLKGWAMDTATDQYNLDRLIDADNAGFRNILDRYGVGLNEIADKLRGLVGVGEKEVENVAKDIASPTSNILANVISFILIFAAAFLVLSLLTAILDAIFKFPVLKGINKVLGFLFGVVEAAIIASILSLALSVLVTSLGAISPDLFGADTIENTIICKYFAEHNFFAWVTGVLGV